MRGGVSRRERVTGLSDALQKAVRQTVADHQPIERDEIMLSLAAAVAMVVSYDSAQTFLDMLGECFDAKEHARAIAAGEVPDVH